MNKKRLAIIAIAFGIIIAALSFGLAQAQRKVATKNIAPMSFEVTKVTPKPDDRLTRVKGNLIGRPHTSNRIDQIILVNGNDTVIANDIDGIDFKRYFQWEDDGVIEIEIDFPARKKAKLPSLSKSSRIIFLTVNGECVAIP